MSNPEGNENNNTYNHIKYTDEKYLTKKAIQSAIFNAVKAKTNINLVGNGINDDTNNDVDCINNNKTGGPWSDAIWLKTNDITTTTTNNDETTTTTNQYVLGNIYDYSTREIGTYENNNQQETLNLSDNVDNVKIKTYKTITNENEETAETINNNILNISNTKLYRIPMIDGKFVLEKMLYNDISKQNLESIINKLKFEVGFTDDDIVRPENIPDIEKQRLMLCGYDIVETVNNGNPSSKIYEYEKEHHCGCRSWRSHLPDRMRRRHQYFNRHTADSGGNNCNRNRCRRCRRNNNHTEYHSSCHRASDDCCGNHNRFS